MSERAWQSQIPQIARMAQLLLATQGSARREPQLLGCNMWNPYNP